MDLRSNTEMREHKAKVLYGKLRKAAFPDETCRAHCTAYNGILAYLQDAVFERGEEKLTQQEAIDRASQLPTTNCGGPLDIKELITGIRVDCAVQETTL